MDKMQTSQKFSSTGLNRARSIAALLLSWEVFWPLALPLFCILGLFVSFSWLGLWPLLHDIVRIALLIIFAVGLAYGLRRVSRFKLPTTAQINRRIERASRLSHRPVSAQTDRQVALGEKDAFTQALWQAHQNRIQTTLGPFKTGFANPKVAAQDPYALRCLVFLFLFMGALASWGNWGPPLLEGFRSHTALDAQQTARIDAWLTPPAYTNQPPIFLTQKQNAATPTDAPSNLPSVFTVPQNSTLVIRMGQLNPDDHTNLSLRINRHKSGETTTLLPSSKQEQNKENTSKTKPNTQTNKQVSRQANTANNDQSAYFETRLNETASLTLLSGETVLKNWAFTVTPDHAPHISFIEIPKAAQRGALEFSYRITDDYGAKSAWANIKPQAQNDQKTRPLIKAPTFNLALPALQKTANKPQKAATLQYSQDLTAHPWAGSQVFMTLHVKDHAEQEGQSQPTPLTLPERVFAKPLALALVEQRRLLALDAHQAPQVANMLEIITTTHPETFINNTSHYMALRHAYWRIKRANNDDILREALDLLWEIALVIEDGNLSRAEQRLREAREKLSKALQEGANEEKIAQLMEELRQAMQEFMQQLAEHNQKNQQNQQSQAPNLNSQTLTQQDIERMMQRIEDLAQSGSHEEARKLLEELQRMMNNLQTAQPNPNRQDNPLNQEMQKLGDLMRQQQQLMDQTFDMNQRQKQQLRQGYQQNDQQSQEQQQQQMTAEEMQQALKGLQEKQSQLQQQLQEMRKNLEQMGIDSGQAFGEADEAMGQARGELGQGQTGAANGSQGQALQALREGAQQMMKEQGNGQSNGQGNGQASGQGNQRSQQGQNGRQQGGQDPLGRQTGANGAFSNDSTTRSPNEVDAQRAREILDAIRRKLSEPKRPKLELDYLDRLLP